MLSRKVSTAIALGALSSLGVVARGETLNLNTPYDLNFQRPVYLDDAPPKPLEGVLRNWGMGQDRSGFNIYGFVEGSYTASFDPPPGKFITGRVFDVDNEEVLLNQADLQIEKTVDSAAAVKEGRWQLGGKIEVVYGADARFLHSNGLNFYGSSGPQLSPENQFDLVQAYVDVATPIGNGLWFRAGKMVTHMGYETINPTTNPLFSHSYMFGYAIPFTHTGVMAFYPVDDKLTVMGGFSRGWDQALEDNNDAVDALGQVKYVLNEKTTAYFNFTTGPESGSNSLWRTVFDGIVTYNATDALSFAANADFGWEPGGAPSGGSAQWYGVALYSGYKLSSMFTVNARAEWFSDPQGARGLSGNMYEVTVGLGIKPAPDDRYLSGLLIRPELRWDYSEDGIFNGGTDESQWTAAIDAIFAF